MNGPFGLSAAEREKLQQFVLSEENGHEFSLWIFHSRTFVACRQCGVLRSNDMSLRRRSACKGPIKMDLRQGQEADQEAVPHAG